MISVVIPVKDGGDDLVRCLEALRSQRVDEDVEIIVVDSGSSDGSPGRARKLGAHVHEIPPEDFNHGRTRNLGAELAQGDVLVFTSQDACAADDDWLASLVAPLQWRPDVAGVYGRQIAFDTAAPPERYFLEFLYGSEPQLQRIDDPAGVNFETTHFSNVNSAIPRTLWRKYPFADDMIMSEDQEWSRRVLLAGHSIVYEPRAAVRHSHTYSIAGAFRRFFDSGVSAERSFIGEGRESPAALRRASIRYARGRGRLLWRTGRPAWIPYTAVYELAKFTGLQLGRRHRRLPVSVKRRLSGLPSYWGTPRSGGRAWKTGRRAMAVGDVGTKDDLVYDVGLHDGRDTAFYLRRGYRVVAVDANPEAIESAEQAFRQEIQGGRLTLVNGAIVASEGPATVTLYLSDQREWSSLLPGIAGRDGVGVREVEVPTTSIAALLARFGTPLYLKIDIEGMDEVALEDLATTAARPIYVSVEAESADDSGASDREALAKLDLLVGMGYGRFKLVDQDTLRVLAMDDLELGPRRSVRSRVRKLLGRRQRERSAVLRVAGRRTVFHHGATGPFGPDLAGEWLAEGEARRLLVAARRAYFRRTDARTYGFWCDWHATSLLD